MDIIQGPNIGINRPACEDASRYCRIALNGNRHIFVKMTFSCLARVVIFLGIIGPWAGDLSAQDPKPRVILYKDRMQAEYDTVNIVKNVFKVNPLLFFRGEVPLYFERSLSPNLSIEVAFGVTLRNYLAMSFAGDDADDFGAGTEIVPNFSYHGGLRFYLTDDLEPQGWYIQPTFAHLSYEKIILVRQPDGTFLEDEKLHDVRTFNDIRLLFGHQMLSYGSNWLFDIYGGVAYRDRHMMVVQERIDLLNSPPTYTYDVEEKKDRIPAFFVGVKVGLGF